MQIQNGQWPRFVNFLLIPYYQDPDLYLLYKFKNIAKQMYLILFIVTIILALVSGVPYVSDMWYYVMGGLGWSVSGAILVLLYFSPIKKEFEK